MKVYTLLSTNIKDLESFYHEVMRVFSLPETFGKNLDALFDTMSEYEGETIVLSGFDGFEEKLGEETLADIMDVFSDAGIEVVLEYGF